METVLVVFGGRSSEHDISCISAETVIRAIDKTRYDVVLAGITRDGRWLYVEDVSLIPGKRWERSEVQAVLSPDRKEHALYLLQYDVVTKKIPIDVVFPVLHGLYGEDGTIQGLLELSGIPYVGPGVFGCAASMDKYFTKILVERTGIRQAAYVGLRRQELENIGEVMDKVEKSLSYPVFVKPCSAGSSKGVSKAANRAELQDALYEANRHDFRILVEESIVGRELECAVYSAGDQIFCSGVGEILAAAEFYDFDAKYNNAESRTDTSPALPEGVEDEIREKAARIFRAVDAYGLSRVDFFLDDRGVVFNEINSIPGFTSISMYPMLFEKRGLTKEHLVQLLLDSAKNRPQHGLGEELL